VTDTTGWATLLQLPSPKIEEVEAGLSDEEVDDVEETFRIRFPPDLRELLGVGVPRGRGFPDWRGGGEALRSQLGWPIEGILFDVSHGLWFDSWGREPASTDERMARAKRHLEEGPGLIPIYLHRYIPSQPYVRGNPVFSMWQSDIVLFGRDLRDYFQREFGGVRWEPVTDARRIRVWTEFVVG
jgi:hypothetical protein